VADTPQGSELIICARFVVGGGANRLRFWHRWIATKLQQCLVSRLDPGQFRSMAAPKKACGLEALIPSRCSRLAMSVVARPNASRKEADFGNASR